MTIEVLLRWEGAVAGRGDGERERERETADEFRSVRFSRCDREREREREWFLRF